jgi:hypothetical protein
LADLLYIRWTFCQLPDDAVLVVVVVAVTLVEKNGVWRLQEEMSEN